MFLGIGVCSLESSRRRAIRIAPGPLSARFALIEAIDGFSHARWLKYLGGVASLSRSLTEGADVEAVLPRLRQRLDSYDAMIWTQMEEIDRLLPLADLDPKLSSTFSADFERIDSGIRAIRRDPEAAGDEALQRLAAAATRMHQTVDEIFQALSRFIRCDATETLRTVARRVGEEHEGVEISLDLPEGIPPVFATAADLGNIMENLVGNGGKAATANRQTRPPRVRIEGRLEGGRFVMLVRDSGPGIAADQREAIFTARGIGPDDHGRGLAYARRRLNQLDGKIEILESSPEEGTTVSVSLRTLRPLTSAAPDGSRS